MAENNNPIIIKKVKKGGHGHHGGAWKLAYADFVTAMMAFFLLMWLLGTTDPAFRQGIAEYFQDPWKPSFAGGANTGDATSVIKGGGEDLTQSEGQVKLTNQGKEDRIAEASETPSEENARQEAQRELLQFEAIKEKIEQMIETSPLLHPFEDQFKVDITDEGLRVQIIDKEGRPMFRSASARLEPYAIEILHQLAPTLNELPNKISIAGHTDANPFPGGGQGYTNWELSADRANAARKELIKGGLMEDRMMRVVGLASSVPFVHGDQLHATNRRISIMVMNKHTAEELAEGSGLVNVSQDKPLDGSALKAAPTAPAPERAPPAAPASERASPAAPASESAPPAAPAAAPKITPIPELPIPEPAPAKAPPPRAEPAPEDEPRVLPGTLTGRRRGLPADDSNVLPGTLTGRKKPPPPPPPAAPEPPAAPAPAPAAPAPDH